MNCHFLRTAGWLDDGPKSYTHSILSPCLLSPSFSIFWPPFGEMLPPRCKSVVRVTASSGRAKPLLPRSRSEKI